MSFRTVTEERCIFCLIGITHTQLPIFDDSAKKMQTIIGENAITAKFYVITVDNN